MTTTPSAPTTSSPSIREFTPEQVGSKPWGEEWLLGHTEHYTLKRLDMKAGHRGGLQYHVEKDETFYLHSGTACVIYDQGDGRLVHYKMEAGQSFHVPPGAVHQVEAITACVFFEASTPHFDDRVHVGAKYGLDEQGRAG